MKFARRKFFKKCLDAIGKESVRSMRSYHLADDVGSEEENQAKQKPTIQWEKENLSQARPRPKKN